MPSRRIPKAPRDPWQQPVDADQFVWTLGYRQAGTPEHGELRVLRQGDGLCCRMYERAIDLELFSLVPNDETTVYGTKVFRFECPATVQTWFRQLCAMDHRWTDTPQDQAEFLECYHAADGEMRVEVIKRFYRSLGGSDA